MEFDHFVLNSVGQNNIFRGFLLIIRIGWYRYELNEFITDFVAYLEFLEVDNECHRFFSSSNS